MSHIAFDYDQMIAMRMAIDSILKILESSTESLIVTRRAEVADLVFRIAEAQSVYETPILIKRALEELRHGHVECAS